jgi:gluconate kinase
MGVSTRRVRSQFDTLEEPTAAVEVDVSSSPAEIVQDIRGRLGL